MPHIGCKKLIKKLYFKEWIGLKTADLGLQNLK